MAIDPFGDSNICVKIWNPETRTVIDTQVNYKQAGQYLGVSAKEVRAKCQNKIRVYSPVLKQDVAVRVANATMEPVKLPVNFYFGMRKRS